MCSKRVQFSCDIEFISTFASEDYDRTAQEVAKLTYKDMLELLTMKSQWKRDMERMLAERAEKESSSSDESYDDDSSNDTCSSSSSSTNTNLYTTEICI